MDDSKNVTQVDLTFLTSTGTANENNDPPVNRMLTLAEIDFYYTSGTPAESIAPVEGTATEMYVGSVESIDAVVYPAECPNQYFTVTSSNPEVASIITLVDENGGPVYKVLGMSAGTTEITLTAAADGTKTYNYTLTVIDGVDKAGLADALNATADVVESLYTADSYAAYAQARENAVAVNNDPAATRADVEAATTALLNAYGALAIQPVDESLQLNAGKVIVGGDALYSESNTYDRMFDDDLTTYWESPYSGSDADLPKDIVLTLADTYTLEQVSFTSHTIQNGGVTEYTISVSLDGDEWTEVTSGTVDADAYKQGENVRVDARFAPAAAKYVKFTVESAVGRITAEDNMYGRIAEMDLYGTTKADKTAFDALIAEVSALDPDAYTAESWAGVSEALEAAKAVSADGSATTADVKTAYDNLVSAREELKEASEPGPTPEDPRTELAVLIGKMSGVENENYTADSWNAFQAKLAEAKAMLDAGQSGKPGTDTDGTGTDEDKAVATGDSASPGSGSALPVNIKAGGGIFRNPGIPVPRTGGKTC